MIISLSVYFLCFFFFFFSSRRRHTRWPRDWSSDVCSSDWRQLSEARVLATLKDSFGFDEFRPLQREVRSEERRVGGEWWAGGCGQGGEKNGDAVRGRLQRGRAEHGSAW